eukprot:TRINITY_DN15270_c0_g1_i1.p1 TRINITY_DN15270_c0_g1~~TRINITY_DN15270_c0_g1_i1.p1  ORF type:complete len:215 (+),score=33.44 TRINITY_DN15270_c0_g1_i1:42-647(+)
MSLPIFLLVSLSLSMCVGVTIIPPTTSSSSIPFPSVPVDYLSFHAAGMACHIDVPHIGGPILNDVRHLLYESLALPDRRYQIYTEYTDQPNFSITAHYMTGANDRIVIHCRPKRHQNNTLADPNDMWKPSNRTMPDVVVKLFWELYIDTNFTGQPCVTYSGPITTGTPSGASSIISNMVAYDMMRMMMMAIVMMVVFVFVV